MAKNVLINGVTYANVPYVSIPLASGSGNAKFVDTDSGDAVAGDIRSGKKAWVDGNEVTGTKPVKSAKDVSVSGENVSVPAGIYDTAVAKTVPTETKEATPSTAAQDITPSTGKLLKKVTVKAVDVTATATEATVPKGVTFFANSLTKKTGTATFPTVGQDSVTKVLTIS